MSHEIYKRSKLLKILQFLQTQKLAVIATNPSATSSPESALVAFAEDSELNIYFQTGADTRKAIAITANPCVSFVVGLTIKDLKTIQYEGKACQLTDVAEVQSCKRLFERKKSPTTRTFLDRPGIKFYKVIPVWVGYSDYTKSVPEVFEIASFS